MNLRDFLDRYGVPLGALAVLALVIALLPGNASTRAVVGATGGVASGAGTGGTGQGTTGGTTGVTTAASGGAAGGGGGATGGGGGGAAGGGTAGGGQSAAGVVFGQGPHCRDDGRQTGISRYLPPCADWAPGTDNGGATADGVTGDKVLVVRWLGQLDDATKAILQANKLSDDDETIRRAFEYLFQYSNQHHETYGREVVFVDFQAHAVSTNEEVMIADAAQIADMHPFAVFEGNPAAAMPTVLMRELNARGVLCICSTSLSETFYAENPFVIPGGLPTANEYCKNSAEYAGKRLAGRNAVYAGDENNPLQHFTTSPRVFGLIYLNGAQGKVDPEGERIRSACESAFAEYGIGFAKQVGFLYDPGRNQNDMTNMIAQMKDAHVTTIVGLWDPLSPILITTEATKQTYFPEWFITGTALSDTTTAGRLYNPLQWSHAFGISPLWVTWADRHNGGSWRAYHHAHPEAPDGSEGVLIEVYMARIQTLFRGVHMAGPILNPDTFRQGLWSYPPTPEGGGRAALPYVYMTPQSPTDVKDFVEVYFDRSVRGPDERSQQGGGMMMKTDNGRRYQLGQWPTDDPHLFQPGAIAVTDNPDGGGNPDHEQDGHAHPTSGCQSCPV